MADAQTCKVEVTFPLISNKNVADTRTCKVEATLPLEY